MTIYDEHSTPWVVRPGDPAADYINTLKRVGFTLIHLPHAVLTGAQKPDIMALQAARNSSSTPASGVADAMSARALLAHVRMLDGLEVLANETPHS